MTRSFLYFRKDGGVERQGVEQPVATITAERGDLIVLKVPGRHYWASRGARTQPYAGAEYQVWQFEVAPTEGESRANGWANLVIDFPVSQRKEVRP